MLAYIAFALPSISRRERADRARPVINTSFSAKQRVFLDFVLSHYITEGVEELDQEKLSPLLILRFGAISDAVSELGPAPEIRQVFAESLLPHLLHGTPISNPSSFELLNLHREGPRGSGFDRETIYVC